ncbi:TlpA family protein disulfide reductase [uncultured Hymenobacter sp.]|uniref:TlpA family protein disulfide reductase n=1 Tax=uncultured Hymenobacter sp. TaxID=170016 RepID=UPI0035CC7D73
MKSNRLFPLLSFVVLWLLSGPARGQVVRYKEARSPKLWTAAEVDTFAQVMNRRGKSAGYEFHPRITKTIRRSDTLIHEYILSGTPTRAALAANQQQLQALVGKPLPAFSLPDLQGQLVSTKSLRGKPVVVNLWFTACAPCIAEMPVLNRIRKEKASSEVIFLAVTFDKQEKVQAFLKRQPFAFRQIAGAKQYCEQFTTGYPTSLFVDRRGIVRSVLGSIPVKYDPVTSQLLSVDDKDYYAALKQIK